MLPSVLVEGFCFLLDPSDVDEGKAVAEAFAGLSEEEPFWIERFEECGRCFVLCMIERRMVSRLCYHLTK